MDGTAKTANEASDGLFDAPDYTAWCRLLYQRLPLPSRPHILFESTIAEPTGLLAAVVRETFGADGVSDRFQSVFGGGNRPLVGALAARYGVDPDQIITTTGASNAIAMALRAFVGAKGGRVAVETPHLDVIGHLPLDAGAEVDFFERRGADFAIDPAAFQRALKGGAKLAIVTNPHNPSGAATPPAALQELAAIAEAAGAHLLIDEVYADFARDPARATDRVEAANLIRVNSLTKVYGLFSLRCGWIIAAPRVAQRIEEANARAEFGVSKLTHAIAAHVLEKPAAFDQHWRAILEANRRIMRRAVAAMQADGLIAGDLPAFGCMYFPRVVGCDDTLALARWLWRTHNLIVAPGEFFGRAGYIRLGFGVDDARLEAGLAALHAALAARRGAPKRAARKGARP